MGDGAAVAVGASRTANGVHEAVYAADEPTPRSIEIEIGIVGAKRVADGGRMGGVGGLLGRLVADGGFTTRATTHVIYLVIACLHRYDMTDIYTYDMIRSRSIDRY